MYNSPATNVMSQIRIELPCQSNRDPVIVILSQFSI